MLKIKLSRIGKRDQAHYRIVVAEARSKRDGKNSDIIGNYTPGKPPILQINSQKYINWLKKGAQPTDTVRKLYQKTLDK